jgi:hypothetical protein
MPFFAPRDRPIQPSTTANLHADRQVRPPRSCRTSYEREIPAICGFMSVLGDMTSLPRPTAGTARTMPPQSSGALRATRCECQRCGVHTFPVLRHTVVSRCHNCGSSELQPVRPLPTRAGGPQLSYAERGLNPQSAA